MISLAGHGQPELPNAPNAPNVPNVPNDPLAPMARLGGSNVDGDIPLA